ncbi:hypothetical protein [Pseudogulbenkiania subflava]|uniref:Uncharacterized protein n=1 Tax=Pseudogulbenkiania subflava DSM 22618 TaxID=1123014 RepID=A0A1Y6B9P8_9NEIS|nr:hypothetical protein [Pseudogulbenkiania subflava]SME92102.1 hypothetical protein SAMN02745746_00048 [Pseudogulbenkiania subflava DSM 22618]
MARTRAAHAATAALRNNPVSMELTPSRHPFDKTPVAHGNRLSIRFAR